MALPLCSLLVPSAYECSARVQGVARDRFKFSVMFENEKHITVSTKTFAGVWTALLVLTAITIGAAALEMGTWSMAANLVIASIKASLVLWFFMHLKYEKKFFKLLILIPVATLTIIIWLTFYDIWYR